MENETTNNKKVNRAIAFVIAAILIAIVAALSSCSTQKSTPAQTGYLLTVETMKPRTITVNRFVETEKADSLVTANFGFAIKGFDSDSMFIFSPYFKIETLNKIVYGEEKEMKNGRMKTGKMKR